MKEKSGPETTQAGMVSEEGSPVESKITRMKKRVKPLAFMLLGILVAVSLFLGGYKLAKIHQSQVIFTPTPVSPSAPPSISELSPTAVGDKDLEKFLLQIVPHMENNNLLSVLAIQLPVGVECVGPYVSLDLCAGQALGSAVEGYQVGFYASEGTVTTYEKAEEVWRNYMLYGPYTFISSEIRNIDRSIEGQDNYAELYFAAKKESKALALVFMKEEGSWILVNSYYGMPLSQLE
jgi:hypothetical protein